MLMNSRPITRRDNTNFIALHTDADASLSRRLLSMRVLLHPSR